ncbi:MAG: insulinase family protein [Proteobacteria bacterium]|nr:insulinase family protein [Pseudomonadota bacterium]MBU1715492.1 insulinase family protein [Pseudomonadota bacterium]
MNTKAFCHLLLPLIFFAVIMKTSLISATELSPHLYKTTLDNGLTVLVKETPGTKAATVQIWIKAGSVYEEAKEGGITHLIEHMIFKGTPTRGPGQIAGAIEEIGGRINAYTYYEYTVYHATLSARHWELATEVLTDAVLNSTFAQEELEREKKVVLEEIAMREDRPANRLFQELMTTSYSTHPYRLPIIGTRESVASFSRDDILKYVAKHYHPENFTVVVVGDLLVDPVVSKIQELFGQLPKGDFVQPPLPQEPEHESPRLFSLAADINQSNLALSFPIPSSSHPDAPVLDVIATLLGNGEASRLYNQLRNKKGLVYQIHSSAFTPKDPGLFEITATLESANINAVLEAILEETFKLKYVPVEEDELIRVKRNLESDFVFALERVEGQARVMGSFEFLTGDPREDDYLAKIRAVTKEDIMKVAAKYFKGRKLTAGILTPNDQKVELEQPAVTALISQAENMARHGIPTSLVADSFLPDVHFFKLRNGIRLLVRENPEIPTVAMRVVFPGGLRGETQQTNGSFAFISALLPKGTKKLSGRELALKIADMAGDISGFNGKNTFGLKADFLARFAEPGLELVRDIILEPAFDPQEAEKVRPELLSILKQQEDSLPSQAFVDFNRLLFQGHPYALNAAGSETAIKNFTVAELQNIYQKHARPDQMVLAVAGAVNAAEIRDIVEKIFGSWQPPTAQTSPFLEESVLPPDAPVVPEILNNPRDKEQVHIVIGFLGTTLNSQDRYGLDLLDTVLSGQSGRLFTELRDKQSMAYSLSSFSLFGLDTGSFGVYIGTSPDKRDAAIKAVWSELYKVRTELISEEELQRAKNIQISQYELGLQTHGSQAMEMALNETYGMGQDFGNRFVASIEKITADEILEIAKKYIQPDHYVMVTVGAEPSPLAAQSATEPSTSLPKDPETAQSPEQPDSPAIDNPAPELTEPTEQINEEISEPEIVEPDFIEPTESPNEEASEPEMMEPEPPAVSEQPDLSTTETEQDKKDDALSPVTNSGQELSKTETETEEPQATDN